MTATTQQTLRDAVARTLDPQAWTASDRVQGWPDTVIRQAAITMTSRSIRKADELLAPGGPIAAHIASVEADRDAALAALNEYEPRLTSLPGAGGDRSVFSLADRIISIAMEAIDGREGERRAFARALAAEAEVARLTAERDGMERGKAAAMGLQQGCAVIIRQLEDRIAGLTAALKPFVEEADRYDPPEGDDGDHLYGDVRLRIGHLRAARSALLQKDADHG